MIFPRLFYYSVNLRILKKKTGKANGSYAGINTKIQVTHYSSFFFPVANSSTRVYTASLLTFLDRMQLATHTRRTSMND